jgi:hypothetical protein
MINNGYATLKEIKNYIVGMYHTDILKFEDNGSGGTRVYLAGFTGSVANYLVNNKSIYVQDTVNYNGLWDAVNVTKDTLDINMVFVGDDALLPGFVGYITNDIAFDSMLESIVETCSRLVDYYCSRNFYNTEEVKRFCVTDSLNLEIGDCLEIDEIRLDSDFDGVFETLVGPLDFLAVPSTPPYNSIKPLHGIRWPIRVVGQVVDRSYGFFQRAFSYWGHYVGRTYIDNIETVQVTGNFGYNGTGAHPESIKNAVLIMAAKLYGRRYAVNGVEGVGTEFRTKLSDAQNLLNDSQIVALLSPYVAKKFVNTTRTPTF